MARANGGGGVNINLHIERLVLDGVNITSDQHRSLQASATTELTRMLMMEGGLSPVFSKGATLLRISTESIQLTGNNPAQLGQKIAQSVYGCLAHE